MGSAPDIQMQSAPGMGNMMNMMQQQAEAQMRMQQEMFEQRQDELRIEEENRMKREEAERERLRRMEEEELRSQREAEDQAISEANAVVETGEVESNLLDFYGSLMQGQSSDAMYPE